MFRHLSGYDVVFKPLLAHFELSGVSDVAPHIPWKRERRQYIARAFGSQKCSVLVADRVRRPDGQQRAQAAAEGIIKSGGCAFAMKVDVSDQTQVEKRFQIKHQDPREIWVSWCGTLDDLKRAVKLPSHRLVN